MELTLLETLSLDILNAVNSNEIHTIGLEISKGFRSGDLDPVQASCLREANTEKLKEFGYKKCGGNGR